MFISLAAVVRIIVMFIREDHVVHHIYLDHAWKTTLAGEYAPPAILDSRPEGLMTGHH